MSEQPVESAPEEPDTTPEPFDPERAQAKIKKANDEARQLRQRLKELEPLAQEADRLRQAQMTETQRLEQAVAEANKAREESLTELVRLRVALRHGIADDDLDLLGLGSEEQIEARAQKIAAKNAAAAASAAPATTRRPAEVLRPGASPDPMPLNGDQIEQSLRAKLGIT